MSVSNDVSPAFVLDVIEDLLNSAPNMSCYRHDNGVEHVVTVHNFSVENTTEDLIGKIGVIVHPPISETSCSSSIHTLTLPRSKEYVDTWFEASRNATGRMLTNVEKAFGRQFPDTICIDYGLSGKTYKFPTDYPVPEHELNRLAKKAGLQRTSFKTYVTPLSNESFVRTYFPYVERVQSAVITNGPAMDDHGFVVTNEGEVVVGYFRDNKIIPNTDCWRFVHVEEEIRLVMHGLWDVPIVKWDETTKSWSTAVNAFTKDCTMYDIYHGTAVDYTLLPDELMDLLERHFQAVKFVPGNLTKQE